MICCLEKVSNDRKLRVVSERSDQLVNHKFKFEDAHLGGMSVVTARSANWSSPERMSQPKSMYPVRKSPTNSSPVPGTPFMKAHALKDSNEGNLKLKNTRVLRRCNSCCVVEQDLSWRTFSFNLDPFEYLAGSLFLIFLGSS